MSKNGFIFEKNMEYQVLSKSKAKELGALSSKKERDSTGLFIAEGEKCVFDMIGAFKLRYLIGRKDWIEKNRLRIEPFRHATFETDKRNMEIISSFSSLPDVIAVFEKPAVSDNIPVLKEKKWCLLLDEIQDPGNLGTIIRTCDWFGVYDIYASKNTADVFGPKVVQASMGSLSRVRVSYLNLKDVMVNNSKVDVVGTLLDGKPVNKVELPEYGFLLMGNEGRGISEELKSYITYPVSIPPENDKAHPDSLNVAIATALFLGNIYLK